MSDRGKEFMYGGGHFCVSMSIDPVKSNHDPIHNMC